MLRSELSATAAIRACMVASAAAALLAAGSAGADTLRLRLAEVPAPEVQGLGMRAVQAPVQAARAGAADDDDEPAPAAPAAKGALAPAGALRRQSHVPHERGRVPGSLRDLSERLLVRFRVGYGLDGGAPSGRAGTSGYVPTEVVDARGDRFAAQRRYVLGDAVLGTEGALLPSMNTYFLSQFAYSMDGARAFSAVRHGYDSRDGRALLVHAAYAELDGLAGPRRRKQDVASNLLVRAGRQYRYGNGRFVASFDGLSVAYDSPAFEISGFAGRRVALYVQDRPGALGGLGVRLTGRELVGVPVDVLADYLYVGSSGGAEQESRGAHYVELTTRLVLRRTRVYARARLLDPGGGRGAGFGLGRLGVRVRRTVGKRLVLIAEAEQRRGRELAYDLLTPTRSDVVDVIATAAELDMAVEPPAGTVSAGARVSAAVSRQLEIYAFLRSQVVHGERRHGFTTTYNEVGAAAAARPRARMHLTAQYKLRLHHLDAADNRAGSGFADTSATGLTRFDELSAELRYSMARHVATATVGAFVRVYDVLTPYVRVDDDARTGARLEVSVRLDGATRVRAAGEMAETSPVYAPELGTLYSLRVLAETTF